MTATSNAASTWEELLDRPLSARSAVASLLLGMERPRLSAARLVRWCELFDISEGTARVALSRMAERGELRAEDGMYELMGRVRARQQVQDWSLQPELESWSGTWRLALIATEGPRAAGDRTALRDAMRRLRFGLVREGVWARPDNLPRAAAPADAWDVVRAQCAHWRAEPDEPSVDLAARLFAPDAWATRGSALDRRLKAATTTLPTGRDPGRLADAFAVGAAVLAHLRADPLLPVELCPRPWPGDTLRLAYTQYRATFAEAVRVWFAAE